MGLHVPAGRHVDVVHLWSSLLLESHNHAFCDLYVDTHVCPWATEIFSDSKGMVNRHTVLVSDICHLPDVMA